ncbi:hypothetical protein Pyn_29900 [Prunus yedoensis var. nudiflora]|uniref:F-box domain-containing protein n=1 Tax=Prunus yedoensis var. nudiflora TaxID=2094558 RepID=A0A314V206_PRUYE|nr:hypothetical protein Pyn_29900 [Prunus yedoensis var. nudiflora]
MENPKATISEGVKQKDHDTLWNLPNDILDQILSLLPTKEAVATSVLSRKWRYVWTSCLVLDFDSEKNMKPLTHCSRYQDQDFEDKQYQCQFVNWVDGVVERHIGPNLEKFRVCFPLNLSFGLFIDKWVKFAVKKRVEVLFLDFSAESHRSTYLGNGLCDVLTQAYGYGEYRALKHLCLKSVGVTTRDIEFVLSNCPCLEVLEVSDCPNLTSLTVSSPFGLNLKLLSIEAWQGGLENVWISEAKLVSFSYSGYPTELELSNVPQLVEVSISERDGLVTDDHRALLFTQLSGCLSQLHTLRIDLNGMVDREVYSVPALPNIRHLELEVLVEDSLVLEQINCFMKACSYMQKLVIRMQFKYSEEFMYPEVNLKEPADANTCSHHHLEVVEIVSFRGRKGAVKIVMFLTKAIVSLKKVVINSVRQLFRGELVDDSDEDVEEEEARRQALHELKRKMPAAISFRCL